MNLSISHVGVYTRPEKHVLKTRFISIGLHLSGLRDLCFRCGKDRHILRESEEIYKPCLCLIPEGIICDFQYGHKRENWVIWCEIPELSYCSGDLFTTLNYSSHSFQIPFRTSITMEQAMDFRKKFEQILELFDTQLPKQLFCAETIAATLIVALLTENKKENVSIARKFKELIESDTEFRIPLKELSKKMNYSVGHLRKLFTAQFQIDPTEYRARLRLRQIINDIQTTDFSLKEIADHAGMKHVTHLHLFLKQYSGVTPGKLVKQFRGLESGSEEN